MTSQVDLIYAADCPNIREARTNLLRAFSDAGVKATWAEHEIGDPNAPERTRGFGSPTVLVDGRDVAGGEPGAEQSCRIYAGAGAPTVGQVVSALAASRHPPTTTAPSKWKWNAAVLPGIGAALLPKVACPLCWPAYAGVLSATGLTFLMEDRWLAPIIGAFLVLALFALGWRATQRRGYAPLALGLASSILIIAGKFALEVSALVYSGVFLLLLATVWNAVPRRRATSGCESCVKPSIDG